MSKQFTGSYRVPWGGPQHLVVPHWGRAQHPAQPQTGMDGSPSTSHGQELRAQGPTRFANVLQAKKKIAYNKNIQSCSGCTTFTPQGQ